MMRIWLGGCLSFLIFIASPAAYAEDQGLTGEFCVQTFNVYATAYSPKIQRRLTRLGDELLSTPCEAMQFQELWQARDYDTLRNRLERGRMAMLFADQIRGDRKMIGLASAFSGSVLQAHSELFLVNNEKGPLDWARELLGVAKGLTSLEVRLDNAPSVTFLNLHTHPTSRSVRVAQILQLIDFTLFRSSRANLLPLVLTGDLNAEPKSLEIELLRNVLLLRDGYLDANGGSYGASCTYCRANDLSWTFGNRVIDFTLYRSSPDIELSAHQSEINLQGNGKFGPLSDHFGVRTQLNWKVRTPVLLASDSPELKERLDLARRTLQKANAVLVKDGSPAMLKAAGLASRLIRRLSETLPMSVDRLYRLK